METSKHKVGRPDQDVVVWDSFIGTTHRKNEDKVFVLSTDEYSILAVFDGVGSAKNNALATDLALYFIEKNHSSFYSSGSFKLENMVLALNEEILSRSKSSSSALSTCAICVYFKRDNKLTFLTLGDTRIYALGKHYVTKLTEDDVLFPGSNVITKCLGVELDNEDLLEVTMNNFKDDILICSDGFYKIFEETKIRFFETFLRKRKSTIKNNLQELLANKNTDDASYVLFKNV